MTDEQWRWLLLEGIAPLFSTGFMFALWGACKWATTPDKQRPSADHQPRAPTPAKRWNAGDVLTTLSGGIGLGLIALALAPASAPVIAAATLAGLVLGHFAKKLDKTDADAAT